MTTILDACFEATDDIWDDREGYLRAALKVLFLDPDADYDAYLKEKR